MILLVIEFIIKKYVSQNIYKIDLLRNLIDLLRNSILITNMLITDKNINMLVTDKQKVILSIEYPKSCIVVKNTNKQLASMFQVFL